MFKRTLVFAVAAVVVAGLGLAAFPGAAATAAASGAERAGARAQTYTVVDGAGSVWASNVIDNWIGVVGTQYGIPVLYTGNGSDTGRADYQEQLVDFAVSDTPYRHSKDKLGEVGAEQTPVGYSYIPLVGGGVAFPYHVSVRGHQITNLRLSGRTIMEIFTGQITNWDNPAITHDYGKQLPSLPIVPVVHAGSADTSFYFTSWLAADKRCDRLRRVQ
jgi:phosphate transport system substrate-binding protein